MSDPLKELIVEPKKYFKAKRKELEKEVNRFLSKGIHVSVDKEGNLIDVYYIDKKGNRERVEDEKIVKEALELADQINWLQYQERKHTEKKE